MYGLHNLPNLFDHQTEVHVALFYMYLVGNLMVGMKLCGGYLELGSSHGCLRVIRV